MGTERKKITLEQDIMQIIRERRIKNEISQEELASIAGIDRASISKLENSRIDPRLSSLIAVFNSLGIRMFLEYEEEN